MVEKDKGAATLLEIFFSMAGALLIFYSFLAYRSLTWSPAFYIKNTDSDKSRMAFVSDQAEDIDRWPSQGAPFDSLSASRTVLADSTDPWSAPVGDMAMGRIAAGNFPGWTLSAAERGRKIYLRSGCALCHGIGGRGGVRNPNAKGGEVPALFKLADTIVNTKPEADRLLALLQQNSPFDEQDPWLEAFVKIKKTFREGKRPLKEDANGADPPLAMPNWSEKLTDKQIHELMAYVLTLFPADQWESWDEPEGESPE
ncbi:MAG: cytochrome c [Acidobacteria bacterium]|nr:cytochrome c [Acidobacteriota bacterium]